MFGSMGFNDFTMPGQQEVVSTGSDLVTISKVGVTSSAKLVVSANPTRRSLWLNNLGTSHNLAGDTCVWLGASTNVSSGITGINFGYLNAGSNTALEHYRGPVYATVGASTATYGVSSRGSSTNVLWIAYADIG
jgi:hypothetical protein